MRVCLLLSAAIIALPAAERWSVRLGPFIASDGYNRAGVVVYPDGSRVESNEQRRVDGGFRFDGGLVLDLDHEARFSPIMGVGFVVFSSYENTTVPAKTESQGDGIGFSVGPGFAWHPSRSLTIETTLHLAAGRVDSTVDLHASRVLENDEGKWYETGFRVTAVYDWWRGVQAYLWLGYNRREDTLTYKADLSTSQVAYTSYETTINQGLAGGFGLGYGF